MNQKYRSTCPISSALDIIGDKWSLLIIRDMMFSGKKTYTEFSNSSEKTSTDILSNRLVKLTEMEIITKGKMEGNKKTNIYRLTRKGRELLPIVLEIAEWSDNNLNDHLKGSAKEFVGKFKSDKKGFVENMYSLIERRDE